jgi:hypothetical protein
MKYMTLAETDTKKPAPHDVAGELAVGTEENKVG